MVDDVVVDDVDGDEDCAVPVMMTMTGCLSAG